MRLVIDSSKAEDSKSFALPLYLAILYTKETDFYKLFNEACEKGYIIYDYMKRTPDDNPVPVNLRLTSRGIDYIEALMLNSEICETKNGKDRYEVLADKLRELYPPGKKPGQPYMWRDSTKNIATRLKGLVKKFNVSFTDEQAISATKRYVESFNDRTYMQLLKYFIMKRRDDTGEFESQFLSFMQNEGQEDEDDNNWITELR